jgi:hypothetical protein
MNTRSQPQGAWRINRIINDGVEKPTEPGDPPDPTPKPPLLPPANEEHPMRLPQAIASAATLLAAAFCFADGATPATPQWTDTNAVVTIFGHVENPGFYSLADPPPSLAKVLQAAVPRPGTNVVIVLQRPSGNIARTIEIRADRLQEDGDIPLRPNEVIQVLPPKAR